MIPNELHNYPKRSRGLSWKWTHRGKSSTKVYLNFFLEIIIQLQKDGLIRDIEEFDPKY